jgi:hypothetical protein
MELIRHAGFTAKKTEKMLMVYTLYKSGLTYRQIERETGCGRGLIAGYLVDLEVNVLGVSEETMHLRSKVIQYEGD